MLRNMGLADRVIRVSLAGFIGIFIIAGTLTGVTAWILGILAVIFLLTSAIGSCPLYMPLNISSRKKRTEAPKVAR